MRILDIREQSVPLSRYAGPHSGPQDLTTSMVAIETDGTHSAAPLTGFGFASFGRFAQGGLIRERFAPRLMMAPPRALESDSLGPIDPREAWKIMMAGEKHGGHGERCVAVGALDMALWDLAAKAAGLPLWRLLARCYRPDLYRADRTGTMPVPVYASGGYPFPQDELGKLRDEALYLKALGFDRMKIKVGFTDLETDIRRIEALLPVFGAGGNIAVDAMNRYGPGEAHDAARAFAPYDLWWFEDICDPLDFETHKAVTSLYSPPISAGEALFSAADARNLLRYGGLRKDHDVLTFDAVHCYGVTGFLEIVARFEEAGWSRRAFQLHGGHLFSLHLAAGLGLGGCECNAHNFQPFGGFADNTPITAGTAAPPELPGIGFESQADLFAAFQGLLGNVLKD